MRNARAADRGTIVELNDAERPAVSTFEPSLFDHFLEHAVAFRIAEVRDRIAGFIVGLGNAVEYSSANYRWFQERYDDLVYVDRIVVAPEVRSRGVGRLLYQDLADLGHAPAIGCEVNIEPPNPRSMAFHQALGFYRVGTRSGGGITVACLRWDVSGESP